MGLFNTPIAALFLSLSIAFSAATAYTTTPKPPPISLHEASSTPISLHDASSTPTPKPSPIDASSTPISLHDATSTPKPSPISLHSAPSNSIRMDEQATDLQYLKSHITSTANKVELFLANAVPDMLTGPETAKNCTCVKVCKELYIAAVEDLKNGLSSVESADFFMVNESLTAFRNDITTCDDCLVESDQEFFEDCSEFGKLDAWAKDVARDLLSTSTKYSTILHSLDIDL